MASRTSNINSVKMFSLSVIICTTLWISMPASADTIYGPVQSRDTLSKIIKRLYTGPRASRLSVMRKIVSENPSAFSNGDMNRLKLSASLNLSGNHWRTPPQITGLMGTQGTKSVTNKMTPGSIDRSAPSLTIEQLQDRMVFLDAERASLIEQVAQLKRETVHLEQKIIKLESGSRQSDEQLRILDAEIIRLTSLLKDKDSHIETSSADLNQLQALQEKLSIVQNETITLKGKLANTKKELSSNGVSSRQAKDTIKQLTEDNQKLQQLLQGSQPGVHYFNNSDNNAYSLSLMSGRLQFPLWLMIVGGALVGLILTALIATRRKNKSTPVNALKKTGINPFSETDHFSPLLETVSQNDSRGFAQPYTEAEENVFKMFDEGTLEVDLKLDMAEAYLEVSDFDSARSILQEVLESGSELQKNKATRLIKKVA